MSKAKQKETSKRIKWYVLAHLGEACEIFREYQEDRLENTIHPERNCKPEKRIELLDKLIAEQLNYIEQLIADIRSIDQVK